MYKEWIIGIIIIQSFISPLIHYQDHIILWDASNWRFKEHQNEITVNEGDNLIFICPPNRTFSQSLYWTNDSRVTIKCNQTLPIKVIKLLDCFGDKYASEFILKVSRFHEISSLPVFHHNLPIHFVAQSVICQTSNFRLSVKLASAHINTSTDTISSSPIPHIQSPELLDKMPTTSNTSSYLHEKVRIMNSVLNVSSTPHINRHFTTNSQHVNWKEYRFLLLPATLAFFTLIGMQIVICSFWLPISVVNKFFKHFRKCKHLRMIKTLSNIKDIQDNAKPLKVTKLNQNLYPTIPVKVTKDSCTKYTIKKSFSDINNLPTSHTQSNSGELLTYKHQHDFLHRKHQFQHSSIPEPRISHYDYNETVNRSIMHENANVLCKCFHQQHQIGMQLSKNHTHTMPILVTSNIKSCKNYTSIQTNSEFI
ncbi:hypothetical protein MN116_003969 [Schistosoma mekongi]|uniref:Ephrin RBD domain-containing protein n=1 Tax=Schistosoma mekongi TaxID=38744 RepID=A0AAE1ZEQ3_SCHME|nr:hypothetical protein MN116_003969 [Schistosoma mekongi]